MTDDLVARLRIKADVILMGERIEWGSDSEIMREAAARIETLQSDFDLNPTMQELREWRSRAEAAEARVRELETEAEHTRGLVRQLQAALMFWMPGIYATDTADNERAADDAYLLAGFDGEMPDRCWGDEMLARVRELEAKLAETREQRRHWQEASVADRAALAAETEACAQIEGSLTLLLAAVHADDPKREILVRIGDLMREAAAIRKLVQEPK